jgi:hypothetical protein
MIKMRQPAMVLNADDVPGARYRMYNTWTVPSTDSPQHILDWSASVARAAPGGYLPSLILNCHGFYGAGSGGATLGGFGLKLGTGIRRVDTPRFGALAPTVSCIWITACGTARISGSSSGDGHALCSEIARAANAYVIAATTHQVGDLWLPYGYIDDFEGLVVRYNPKGVIDWSLNYGRGLIDGLFNGWD